MFGFKTTREEIDHVTKEIERGQAELRALPARHIDRRKHERWIDKAQDHVQQLEKDGKCNTEGCR